MEEKTYVLLVKRNKESQWEEKGNVSGNRYAKELWATNAQRLGIIFSAQIYEMPAEWLVFWI